MTKRRTSRNPPPPQEHRDDPSFRRRYSLPFENSIEGEAEVHYAAELDRCAIIAPDGDVTIGAAYLTQCVVIGPCVIEDGVRATAAILQGRIEEGVVVEAHADIMGTVQRDSIIRRGVVVEHGALVGPDCEIGDLTVIGSDAEVSEGVTIGAQSRIGAHAFIQQDARLPARSVVRPSGHVIESAAERQGEARPSEPSELGFRIVDDLNDVDDYTGETEEEEEEEEDNAPVPGEKKWIPSPIARGASARPGDMAKGAPTLTLRDFKPGTARSWVLSKLGRLANLKSSDGRLTKKLVQQYRPDLLDHAVTKEVLRVTPPITDEVLAQLSFEALSPARYDVYENITFHSGDQPDWQMVGPQTNDVFAFAVPDAVIDELFFEPIDITWRSGDGAAEERIRRALHDNEEDDDTISDIYSAFTHDPLSAADPDNIPEEGTLVCDAWTGDGGAHWSCRAERAHYALHGFPSLQEAKRAAEKEAREWRDDDVFGFVDEAFRSRSEWHPDKHVRRPIGWVRLVVIPPRYVMVVEIQSDRDWMSFRYKPESGPVGYIGEALRQAYFSTFAADALNVVIEWAFSQRYAEVIVPDFESRAMLGGSPPKSFYDDVPKKYTVSAPVSLDEFPVSTYPWVDRKKMKVRRIVPNRGRR